MKSDEITKHDWELLKFKVPSWQEKYMEALLKEYSVLINDDTLLPSQRFHNLEKRIKADGQKAGVRLELEKKHMVDIILKLINEEAISLDDLSDFSDELKNEVKEMMRPQQM